MKGGDDCGVGEVGEGVEEEEAVQPEGEVAAEDDALDAVDAAAVVHDDRDGRVGVIAGRRHRLVAVVFGHEGGPVGGGEGAGGVARGADGAEDGGAGRDAQPAQGGGGDDAQMGQDGGHAERRVVREHHDADRVLAAVEVEQVARPRVQRRVQRQLLEDDGGVAAAVCTRQVGEARRGELHATRQARRLQQLHDGDAVRRELRLHQHQHAPPAPHRPRTPAWPPSRPAPPPRRRRAAATVGGGDGARRAVGGWGRDVVGEEEE